MGEMFNNVYIVIQMKSFKQDTDERNKSRPQFTPNWPDNSSYGILLYNYYHHPDEGAKKKKLIIWYIFE